MSYSTSTPNSNNSPALDVQQMQDNFVALDAVLKVNHVELNLLPDQGKHNFIQMPNLTVGGSIPAATAANEYALYTTSSGLFLRPPSQVAGTITNDVNLTECSKATPGWTRLPTGIILQWGTGTINAGQYYDGVALPKTLNTVYSGSICVMGQLTGDHEDYILGISISTTTRTAYRKSNHKGSTVNFYWTAIGV